MTSRRKLIVVLIDGLSADYFNLHRHRLPYLDGLVARGTQVRRLTSPTPATSMPGRTSMITGRPSQEHGVFGNHVFDGETFRCATPDDVVAPTILARAQAGGLKAASVGFAMADPKDADLYQPPWWLRSFMGNSRFAKALDPSSLARLYATHGHSEPLEHKQSLGDEPSGLPQEAESQLMLGLASDQLVVGAAAELACSDEPPDLILTEIAMTDQIQHRFGFASPEAHWSLGTADMLIGHLMHRLREAGRDSDYVVAITSDHGHSTIDTAINPSAILSGMQFQSEGATLHVAVQNKAEGKDVEQRLQAVGAESIGSMHVPSKLRDRVVAFAAPPRHSFEEAASEEDRAPLRKPMYVSSHGLRPGTPADDRFCVFTGSGIGEAQIERADAEAFASTLASVLALPVAKGDHEPLF